VNPDAATGRRIIPKKAGEDLLDKRQRDPIHAQAKRSPRQSSEIFGAKSTERPVPDKSGAAKKDKTALQIFRFQRTRTPGIIEVLNEHSYVMAEYSQRTGAVKWQRMALASQREQVEKWLEGQYPKT
jgi:hypothetical protein